MALDSRYGIVVREMRQDRNLTINYVASGIMSVSGLSRFERGEVMTTLENLVKLLNRMNINMTEYLYRVNRHLWPPSIVFFRELTNALRAGNSARIKELAQSEKEKIVAADDPNDQYRLNTVVAAAALAILDGPDPSSDDIKLVTDYLSET
ncbi:helix-turn-helix domain-containing protein [Schleiferilactobacillus harbinensis]|jgi:transcriptional regulator with XRE-family HTH domain|uniref:helix-turn-helix domain-containing protein n=1 Tax=Schleiferilactobacillus harbinensis TaxID=304207 RepID=UPI002670FBB9|nr:helix-turn-helix transcriptional regulator [Schleiferilactobacillus harbinensis]